MIFDTHAHYDDEQFDSDREAVLTSLLSYGVTRLVDVGSTAASLDKVHDLTASYDFIYGAYGLHPDEAGDYSPEIEEKLRALLKEDKTVAVGEIGLDYYWDKESHDLQERVFRAQIGLALEAGKPIIVHSRSAAEDTLAVISSVYGKGEIEGPGIIHCYSYSPEMAETYVKMGFLIGIGGVATFKNSKKLKKTIERLPLTSLALETDCPYLAPEPHRGHRNFSGYLPHVVRAIAELKGVEAAEVEAVTYDNACRLFGIGRD